MTDNSNKKKHPSHASSLNCLLSTCSLTLFLCSNVQIVFWVPCSTRKINSSRQSIWLIAFISQSSITYQNILGRHVASDCRWSSGILQSSIFFWTNKCWRYLLLDFSTCLQKKLQGPCFMNSKPLKLKLKNYLYEFHSHKIFWTIAQLHHRHITFHFEKTRTLLEF